MKKMLAFLLAFMMLMGVMFIFISAEETTTDTCTCGGNYSAWEMYATTIQQVRYSRQCDACGKVQSAKDVSPTTVSYSVPAIGANAGDTIFLSLYSVYYNSNAVMSADSITWSSDELTITNGTVCPTEAGTYKLTATSGKNTKDVFVVAKNVTDTEYVLFFDDFNGDTLSSDYTALEIPNNSEYYVENGKLIMDAYVSNNKDAQMRILLPSWIGNFGNYKIDTRFTINAADDNSYWFATMARIQNEDFPFWQAAIRKNATASNGVEIAKRTKASGQSNGWNVPSKGSYKEAISSSDYYTQTFELSGKTATHSINGSKILTYTSVDNTVGRVGFHLRASKVSIDSVKITLPITDATHNFTSWETITAMTCTIDGLDRRECTICGTVEERVIKAAHTLTTHALKMPTCTEAGYQAYETCSVCDYTTFNGLIDPLGHYFDREFHSIAHRGYSAGAPQNTLPAYQLAAEMGYVYVECDIALTKDGVAVLLHDKDIGKTSDGTGNVSGYTYEELLQYNFAYKFDANYKFTKIPTFVEFIECCKELGLHPYIELKNTTGFTQDSVNSLVAIVESYGMLDNCTWISFSSNFLKYVKNADETARLGYLSSLNYSTDIAYMQSAINTAKGLQNGKNEVFLDLDFTYLTEAGVLLAAKEGFAVEAWTIDKVDALKKLPKYISGVASNTLYAEEYFLSSEITAPTCGAQGYTTYTCACGATKVADYVNATEEHTAENGVCTECGADVYCANKEHNLEIISIAYANGYDKDGVKIVKCLDCDAKKTETVAEAFMICIGYSAPEDGRAGVTASFKVNNNALKEYETVTGKSVRYGAFAVAQSNIGDNEIFDANGNLQSGVILADVADYEFSTFDIVIIGFEDSYKDLPFAMGAYVTVTGKDATEYSYVQYTEPTDSAAYSFVTYNNIANQI